MDTGNLRTCLLSSQKSEWHSSHSSSYEDIQEALTNWSNISEKAFQESLWLERLQAIHNALQSTDNHVAAGRLLPALIQDIKKESEEELATRYRQLADLETTKETLRISRDKKLTSTFRETPHQPIVDIIRLIQRKNNSTLPHIDFCTSRRVVKFCLSKQGDKLAIATQDNQLKIWSLDFNRGVAWCVAQKSLAYSPHIMRFNWNETQLLTAQNSDESFEQTHVCQQSYFHTLLEKLMRTIRPTYGVSAVISGPPEQDE
jgi:hypothetical protein